MSAVFCTLWPHVVKPTIYLYLSRSFGGWSRGESHGCRRGHSTVSLERLILKYLWSTRRLDSTLNYEKFFCFILSISSYLSCSSSFQRSNIPSTVCRSSLCITYTLSWIPFDLQACLPCYANKAASAIGFTVSTSRFWFSACYKRKQAIFFLKKWVETSTRKVECAIIVARLTNDKKLDVYWNKHNEITPINWTRFPSNNIFTLFPPTRRLLQRELHGTDIKHRFSAFYGAPRLVARFMLAYSSCRIMMIIFHEGHEEIIDLMFCLPFKKVLGANV